MSREFTRRSFLAASLGAPAALGVLGEESPAGALYTNGRGRDGLTTKRPRRGGRLTVGVSSEEQGFNPTSGRFDAAGFMYARTVFDPLMAVTASGDVVPYLAESVTHNTDYTQWTVTVRPGVRFHDGTPCDGAALLTNMERQYASPLTGIAVRPLVSSYRQSGPRSVTITMTHPWVTFPYSLAEQQTAFIAAPSMLNAPDGGSNHPIGTGPFVFQEWVPNDHFTATANPNYWRPGLPYLDAVTFKPIPDENARSEALQSGSIAMMHGFDPTVLVTYRGNDRFAYVDNSGTMVGNPDCNCIMLNCAAPPFDDPVARRALAAAVSSPAFAKVFGLDIAGPINGIYQPGSVYYTPHLPYPAANMATARKLVKAYEAHHHAPLHFTLTVVASPSTVRAGEYLQQVLHSAGITMSLTPIEQNQLIDNALYGTFQATEWSQFGSVSPDLNYVWFSTTTAHDTGLSINMARNSDPRIETAMLTGLSSPNPAKRIAAFRRVNVLLAQDLPYIWLDRLTSALISAPSVENWDGPTAPGGTPLLANQQGVWWLTSTWLAR